MSTPSLAGSRRSLVLYAMVLPFAVLTGATAAHGVESAVFLGVALVGALVVLLGSLTAHRVLVGRLVLWAGILLSLGIKAPRRAGGEVISTPLTFANSAPVLALLVAVGAAMLLCRVRVLPLTRSETWLGLFLVVALASSFWSVAPAHSTLRACTLIGSYLALVLLARAVGSDNVDPLAELDAVVHLLIASVLVSIALAPAASLAPIPGAVAPVGRLKGALLYIHPNALAFLAVIGIVLAVYGVGLGHLRDRWSVRAAVIAVDAGVLLATRTRSALVLVVLVAALGALLDQRMRRRLVILIPAVLGLVFVVLQLSGASILGFVAREQSTEQLTGLTGRVEEWDRAITITMESPIIGQGYYAGHRFGALAALEGDVNTTTDNAWVDVAIDLGVLGLVPLVVFVGLGGASLVRALRQGDRRAQPAVLVFAACLAASFVNPSLNETNYWMLVFAFVILAVAPSLDPVERTAPGDQRATAVRERSASTPS